MVVVYDSNLSIECTATSPQKGYDGDRAPLKEWEARAHTLLPLYIARDAGVSCS